MLSVKLSETENVKEMTKCEQSVLPLVHEAVRNKSPGFSSSIGKVHSFVARWDIFQGVGNHSIFLRVDNENNDLKEKELSVNDL